MSKKIRLNEADLKDLKLFLSEDKFAPGNQSSRDGLLIQKIVWPFLEKFNLAGLTSRIAGDFAAENNNVDFTVRWICDEESLLILIENFMTGDLLKKKSYPKKSFWKFEDDDIPDVILWCIWINRVDKPWPALCFPLQKGI